jgi:hypothetical protein
MIRVYVESPYAARAPFTVADHECYARICMTDSLKRGEAPLLSHLLYTQCLADTIPDQRRTGMEAGFAWAEKADLAAVYYDLGVTNGMNEGIRRHRERGVRVELRRIFSPAIGRALRAGYLNLTEAASMRNPP